MITVLAFARYRELLGFEHLELPLPDPPTVEEMLRDARFATLPPEALVAVNQRMVRLPASLSDGDVVALMPPVSGG